MDNHKPVVRLPGYLTIPEVAHLIGKSRHTVYRLIRDGDLVAVKTGRTLVVRESDFLKYRRRAS